MSALTVDTDVVARICYDAPGAGCVLDVVGDQLDGTVWVRLASSLHAGDAVKALGAHGLGAHACDGGRVHVIGWDTRLLRWRLGVLLGGWMI